MTRMKANPDSPWMRHRVEHDKGSWCDGMYGQYKQCEEHRDAVEAVQALLEGER